MLPMAPGPERMTLAMRSLEATFLIGVEGVTEIWLVRHGDCYEGMSDGADPPLSALGRNQAELLGKRIGKLKHDAVYSSPYRRALETARAISDDVHVDEHVSHARAPTRARAAALPSLLHVRERVEGARRPADRRHAGRHLPPTVNDQIRSDLEREIGQLLSRRPEFRIHSIEPIPEGHSGFTYFVSVEDDDGPARYVLRLPPPGARIAGPADVVRQGRIMSSLHHAGIPTPAIPLMSSDPAVDGRPFILMEAVDGTRIERAGAEQRPLDISASAVEVLKRIQA